jgi:PST family polysaccharide transporter
MKIDKIMLGLMLGDEAVGIYSAATRISEVWYFVPMMIVASVFPTILEAKKQSEALYQQRLQRLYDLMVWLSVAVALPITFLSDPIVVLLYGPDYAEAGTVLAIHIWASIFVFLGVASGQWFIAENRQILSFQRTFLGALINVVLNCVCIPQFGVVGAAYATLMAQASVGLLYDVFQKETQPMFNMKIKSFSPLQLTTYITNKSI